MLCKYNTTRENMKSEEWIDYQMQIIEENKCLIGDEINWLKSFHASNIFRIPRTDEIYFFDHCILAKTLAIKRTVLSKEQFTQFIEKHGISKFRTNRYIRMWNFIKEHPFTVLMETTVPEFVRNLPALRMKVKEC